MVTYKQLIYTITMVIGINAQDAQVVEVHDCFSTNELLTYEALVSYKVYMVTWSVIKAM